MHSWRVLTTLRSNTTRNDSGYRFWVGESLCPNSMFLTSLYWQKQSQTKMLIKNDTIQILKSVFQVFQVACRVRVA